MKPAPGRLESIDVARGLAALSVAIYHQGYGTGLVHLTHVPAFSYLDLPGSRLAVPLFFVISGFCIHLGGLARQGDAHFSRAFFTQRFFRIYPPWLTALAASMLVAWMKGQPATGPELLTHLTLTNGFFDDYRLNPVLWSISVESMLYLLYPAWLAFRRRYGLTAGFGLGVVVSIGSSAITFGYQPEPSGPTMWFFLNVWCGWLAGAVLAENLQPGGPRLLRRAAWWIGGGVAILLHLAGIRAGFYHGPAAYAVLPVTIMLSVWPLSALIAIGETLAAYPDARWLIRGWRGLAHIGLFSYSLYLLHVPLQAILFFILPHLASAAAKGLLFAGWLGVVLLGSWLHYHFVEVPSTQWGRRILARQRATLAPPSVLPT
jgi:peptidoglycan/LPS O-acetylase OafA/YrhL